MKTTKVLVAEDYDDARDIMSMVLQSAGFQVLEARDGIEALEAARSFRPTIIVMDMFMPNMDGLTATREIRKNPRWQKLPIIAVTAKAMKEDQEKCLAAGANDYLAKPIELERLFSLMRVWMPKLERIL